MDTNFLTGLITDAGSSYDTTLAAFGIGLIVFFILLMIAFYIYISFAYVRLGEKAKVEVPAMAWIPGVGPLLISYYASRMDSKPWWSLLIGLGAAIIATLLLIILGTTNVVAIVIAILLIIAAVIFMIYFSVYSYIWSWKLFEAVGRSGWWR